MGPDSYQRRMLNGPPANLTVPASSGNRPDEGPVTLR